MANLVIRLPVFESLDYVMRFLSFFLFLIFEYFPWKFCKPGTFSTVNSHQLSLGNPFPPFMSQIKYHCFTKVLSGTPNCDRPAPHFRDALSSILQKLAQCLPPLLFSHFLSYSMQYQCQYNTYHIGETQQIFEKSVNERMNRWRDERMNESNI